MKAITQIIITTLVTIFSVQGLAAQIIGGTYEKSSDSIVIEVVYQGGCKVHTFEVRMNLCNRALPASCTAELVDLTKDDACRGVITDTVKIPANSIVGGFDIERLFIQGQDETFATIEFM